MFVVGQDSALCSHQFCKGNERVDLWITVRKLKQAISVAALKCYIQFKAIFNDVLVKLIVFFEHNKKGLTFKWKE